MTFDEMLSGPETEEPDQQPAPPRRAKRPVSVFTVLGLVLILAGVGALGWVGYQYVGTNVVSERQFTQAKEGLRQGWDQPPPSAPSSADGAPGAQDDPAAQDDPGAQDDPAAQDDPIGTALPGDAIALLRVPDWGADYEVPILKGTSLDILSAGVGMYTSAVSPGAIGNFAIAGHRITHGEPFSRLLELKPGSQVIIETRSHIYTYVMDNSPADVTVDDSAGWVLDPVPGEPDTKPTKALITLTTCQDLFRSPDRSIGFGHLDSTVTK